MACSVFDGIAVATESLSDELNGRLSPKSLWKNFVPREAFPMNRGLEQTTFRQGNIEPTDLPDWDAESLISDENVEGACSAPDNSVSWGYDQFVYAPEKTQFHGPLLCKEQFTYEHVPDKFLEGYLGRLAMFSDRVLSFRLQEHYISNSNKYIAGDNVIIDGQTLSPGANQATLPAVEPSSELTQDMLDEIAVRLNEAGAAEQTDPTQYGFFDWGANGPLYTLYIGQQMSNKILRNDPDNVTILNYSEMGKGENALLRARLGAAKQYYNFKHVINPIPPRYNWNGATLVRIPVYINDAGSGKGVVSVYNPDWLTADVEAAFILNPLVMTMHVVQPDIPSAVSAFNPIDYHGEWKFVVGGYKLGLDCADPLDRFGRHYAVFRHAIEPINRDYGYTIFYTRCVGSPLEVGCS